MEDLPQGCENPTPTRCASCLKIGARDAQLVHEALSHPDGSVVHQVYSWLAVYNSCFDLRDRGKLTPMLCRHMKEAELRLRKVVARQRLEQTKEAGYCSCCD